MIRDISREREVRTRLEQKAQEQKQLAARYNHLLQSVLCGIVQYRSTGHGVVFREANREAIRIFGYTPEEFWGKKYWKMEASEPFFNGLSLQLVIFVLSLHI